jgi:hypothetical protein
MRIRYTVADGLIHRQSQRPIPYILCSNQKRMVPMEPRKFTEPELAALIAEAVAWLQQQRERYRPSAVPLTPDQTAALQPFFFSALLSSVRILDVSLTGETIPYPPFYERVRAGGSRVVPDAAHMTAMPFVDVAVFNREPTLRTLFHNLVHVAQFSALGAEVVMKSYFHVLNESGLWIVAPVEEQAYQLDGRYTKDPTDFFSVANEIEEWLRSGRY